MPPVPLRDRMPPGEQAVAPHGEHQKLPRMPVRALFDTKALQPWDQPIDPRSTQGKIHLPRQRRVSPGLADDDTVQADRRGGRQALQRSLHILAQRIGICLR